MTTVTVKCLECDVPTKNGNVYPREELQQAIDDLGGRELLVTLGYSGESIDLKNVIGATKSVSIIDNYLVSDIRFCDGPLGEHVRKMLNTDSNIGVRPASICSPPKGGTIRGIEFLYFAVVQNPT